MMDLKLILAIIVFITAWVVTYTALQTAGKFIIHTAVNLIPPIVGVIVASQVYAMLAA
ncbi:hypothetical protein [Ignicoccus hospitalis]|uniref:hypothetical protein n=1 Tax=Ignicoccus hospitalis TaxID=160233 RepID=UPI00164FF747|nr:hypothetical protein [Ignicoccus hospitalis]